MEFEYTLWQELEFGSFMIMKFGAGDKNSTRPLVITSEI